VSLQPEVEDFGGCMVDQVLDWDMVDEQVVEKPAD